MAKFKDFTIFLTVFAVSIAYFIVKTYGDNAVFSATLAYVVMAVVSLLAMLYSKSEEAYYCNLTVDNLAYVLAAVTGMIVVSSLFSGVIGGSVLYYPHVYASLTSVGVASSIFTAVLSEMVYQLSAVATGEELLKFSAYTELKARYGQFLAVALAVGLWAGFHALQAYPNILYIVPAFICGLILVWLLEATHNVIPCIIAHGTYNVICFASTGISRNMPIFPTQISSADILLTCLAAMWIVFILLPVLTRRS